MKMDGDDWARAFLAVELKSHVPEEIRELFDVARGAMLYGWFYYPHYVLGESQLHRITEAAVKACYRRLHGPRQRPSFAHAVEWLAQKGVIKHEDLDRWGGVRELRNAGSHPHRASVMPPGHVLRILTATAHDINRLFARAASTMVSMES